MSDLLPSNQSTRANAWPKIAVSRPLMEFTHEEIAKNGEDGGAWGMGQKQEAFSLGSRYPEVPYLVQ